MNDRTKLLVVQLYKANSATDERKAAERAVLNALIDQFIVSQRGKFSRQEVLAFLEPFLQDYIRKLNPRPNWPSVPPRA